MFFIGRLKISMSAKRPNWLPEIMPYSGYSCWKEYIDDLHRIFQNDFVASQPIFMGKPVFFDRRIREDKPEGFWHIITSDDPKGVGFERGFSPLRCERLCWIKPIIMNCSDSSVLVWEKEGKKRGEKRHCIFLFEHDYVIILVERKNFLLVTAYYVNYGTRKQQLIKEYELYKSKTAPATGTV